MNNKGLTLVELLGVLIVLSLIVSIVVPSVTRNLKTSRVQLCEHQLDSLVSASKNWLTDKMNESYGDVFKDGFFQSQIVDGKTLESNGYVTELDKEYKDVQISITKDGRNYVYSIVEREKYCK